MTLDLGGRRTALAEALAAGLEVPAGVPAPSVHRTFPARLTPPAVLVTEGSPYLDAEAEGLAFGQALLRWQVDVVAATGTNQAMTDQLDQLAGAAWEALATTGYALESVGQFYTLQANGTAYLAVRLTVSEQINV